MFYQVKFIKKPETYIIDELASIKPEDIKDIILDEANSHYVTSISPSSELIPYIMAAGFYKIHNYNYIVYIPKNPGYLLSLSSYMLLYDKITSHIRNEKIDIII